MNNITSESRINFFQVERYCYESSYTFDASCSPRPHFCMGLLLRGKAEFFDCTCGESIALSPGEIIFVPVTNRYTANWVTEPDVMYISIHFLFDYPAIFTRHKNFKLQKIVPENVKNTREIFERILQNHTGGEQSRLFALSEFFGLLAQILPCLEVSHAQKVDERILDAVSYIEEHYSEQITVEMLAARANMSVSRFFPCFRSQLGVTPVDYINHYRVSRAIIMLVNNEEMSVEQISSASGFESSAYFRRVFKKITGKNPKSYRGISAEI